MLSRVRRNIFPLRATRECLRSRRKMSGGLRPSVCETGTRFHADSHFFFILRPARLGVKSISVRIGEKFMRRCRPRVAAYTAAPFLARARARAESAGRLLSPERSLSAYAGLEVKAGGPPSSRPTHFTRVNRGEIYCRSYRLCSLRSVALARCICMHALLSPFVRSFLRSPFPFSLRKSSRALCLVDHDVYGSYAYWIGPRRAAPRYGLLRN